jgi:hypothetical protein
MRRPLRVKFILPALTEATSPYWRPIKYSLFPPLGLATLAAYLAPDDEAEIVDEHVAPLETDDRPDLVVIQVYITNARRAYRLADAYRATGTFVALGGLHVTALPAEAARHADAVFLGPGEQTFPRFLDDLRAGHPHPLYASTGGRTLERLPPVRRDLIRRRCYLVPNSIVVTRGCPQHCDFCYKDAFFEGGRTFYTQRVDDALAEIARLPGRHLYFLDDHLLGDRRFSEALFDGMRGMRRLFQGAATVDSILRGDLVERAAEAGLRSLFVGFETLTPSNLARSNKRQNLGRDYAAVAGRLHDLGIMINGSFVFGMDDDDEDVFLPYPNAVSGNEAVRADGGGRTDRDARLGPLRHAACRLSTRPAFAGRPQGGLRLGLRRVLSLVVDRAGLALPRIGQAPGQTFLLRGRLEEVRTAVGRGDSGEAASNDDAASRGRSVEGHGTTTGRDGAGASG